MVLCYCSSIYLFKSTRVWRCLFQSDVLWPADGIQRTENHNAQCLSLQWWFVLIFRLIPPRNHRPTQSTCTRTSIFLVVTSAVRLLAPFLFPISNYDAQCERINAVDQTDGKLKMKPNAMRVSRGCSIARTDLFFNSLFAYMMSVVCISTHKRTHTCAFRTNTGALFHSALSVVFLSFVVSVFFSLFELLTYIVLYCIVIVIAVSTSIDVKQR